MKITNDAALPQPFVDAVTPRKPQPDVLRVTELIGPPLIRQLMLQHWDILADDASERVWSVFGQGVHAVLEAASTDGIHLVEQELVLPISDIEVRGRPDLLATEGQALIDYKVTSVWSVILGDKVDWERQLNVYAHLLRRQGQKVRHLENVCILRDWSRHGPKGNPDYPPRPVHTIHQRVWSDEECQAYIAERVALHKAEAGPCTPEERWERPTTYAVMKPGLKKATRVLDTQEAAEAYIAQNLPEAKATVVKRPGASVRCEEYCPVRAVCQYRGQFVQEGSHDQSEG